MYTYTGKELEDFVKDTDINKYDTRDSYHELMKYIHGHNDRHIMALFGLRRTGKTVMMLQAMRYLPMEKTILLRAERHDGVEDIHPILRANPDCKYIFIDEATRLHNFVNTASVLADHYAMAGKKVIIAGTDSFGIALANQDELYDRCNMIHTTYISFAEYHRLLHRGLDDYMKYGGTLTPESFYNPEKSDEYINSSIINNISHGLEQIGRDGAYDELRKYRDSKEFKSLIQKIIEIDNRKFTDNMVRKMFKSHDFGSLVDLIAKHPSEFPIDAKIFKSEKFQNLVREQLEIKNVEETKFLKTTSYTAVQEAIDYLKKIDVLYEIKDETKGEQYIPASVWENEKNKDNRSFIFTQPGLRYSQLQKESWLFSLKPLLDCFQNDIARKLEDTLRNDIEGKLLENIIFVQLAKNKKIHTEFMISKYNAIVNSRAHEIDICLVSRQNNDLYIMEVKNSKKIIPEQTKHLTANDFTDDIQKKYKRKIAGKAVIYRGATTQSDNGIMYIRAEEMLCKTNEALLETKRHWERFSQQR